MESIQDAPFVAARCVLCGEHAFEVICPAAEVRAHLKYLQGFHRRRLRPTSTGKPPREALADRADFTQDYATDIVACTGCGLVFRSPRPGAHAIMEAYAQDQYGSARLEALFAAQVELYRPKTHLLRRWLPRGSRARIVEVGSFVGGFLAAGQEQGWDMMGVDPGAEVNAFCRRKGFPVFQGTLTEAPLKERTIDCIAIWNTFDQLPDPEPTLLAACRLLRPGGLLVVRAPNGECFRQATAWMQKLPRVLNGWLRAAMAWNNLLAFPYLHGYSARTLDKLFARYGLRRVAFQPDTLPRLSDEQTKRWAAREERILKLLCAIAARLETSVSVGPVYVAPWFDACYRQALQSETIAFPVNPRSSFSLQPAVA